MSANNYVAQRTATLILFAQHIMKKSGPRSEDRHRKQLIEETITICVIATDLQVMYQLRDALYYLVETHKKFSAKKERNEH